jgi:hypothetical protein
MFGRSLGGYGEVEIGHRRVRKVAQRYVEMGDAGSLHSRRRVLTAGAKDPLPIVRLPKRFGFKPASAESSQSRTADRPE